MSCFYRYAEQEGLIATSPAAHVRRPRLDYESHATGPESALEVKPWGLREFALLDEDNNLLRIGQCIVGA